MSKIILVENRSEIGAGTRGSSLAVNAIRIAAINKREESFFELPSVAVENINEWIETQNNTPYALHIKKVLTIFKNIVKTVSPIIKKGDFPIIISGDHSNAGGTIAAIKTAMPDKRLGVVWIDAHADLHSPFTTPSGNIHGKPLAISLGEDNEENAVNQPNEQTIETWNKLKTIGNIEPKILPEDLVFVGVRSTEKPEEAILDKYQIPNFTLMDMVLHGVPAVADKILEKLKDVDAIYISFDVDSLDLEFSRGTGTPVDDGLSKHQAIELIKMLVANPKTVAFEVVEVNPLLDLKGNLMAEMALETLIEVKKTVENR